MFFPISVYLAVSSIFAQSDIVLPINGWWVIVIFLALVVVISLLMLGNRQEPAIPPAAGHGHEHGDLHPSETVEVTQTAMAEIPLRDDLAKIEGIGPKIAALLSEHSINTFRALANTEVDELNRILDQARLTFADPSSWPEQAQLADLQEWEALSALQAHLKGGRH